MTPRTLLTLGTIAGLGAARGAIIDALMGHDGCPSPRSAARSRLARRTEARLAVIEVAT